MTISYKKWQAECSRIKNEVLSKFEKDLQSSGFILERGDASCDREPLIEIDGIIKDQKKHKLAFIRTQPKVDMRDTHIVEAARIDVEQELVRYDVLTDGSLFYLLDANKRETSYKESSYEEIIDELREREAQDDGNLICEYIENEFELCCSEDDLRFGGDMCSLRPEKERELINESLKLQESSSMVYRYVPLETAFKIIETGKIRMLGIAGMNDSSEVNYVWNFLYKQCKSSDRGINKTFITSCSVKDEDLTQWRLYADDAKGARLGFKIKRMKDAIARKFVMRNVKYCDLDNDAGIKKLKGIIDFAYRNTGSVFEFKTFHEWGHFIKPKVYENEEEIRLLFQMTEEEKDPHGNWLIARGSSIVTPYVEFDLDEKFPLELKDIKLGPKCSEPEVNRFQLEELAKSLKRGVDVKVSEIKNYR